jgi:putative addiction module killer protein
MTKMWHIEYLDLVEEWLDTLTTLQLKSVAKEIKLLEMCGNNLALPHSRALGEGLFELRERRFGLRVYYCFHRHKLCLLSAGNKKQQEKDIQYARFLLKHLKLQ